MKTMTLPVISGVVGSLLMAPFASANTGAHVEFWAPGMTSPMVLNSYGMNVGVYVGRPYRYEIWGIAGHLTLGDQADNATLHNNGRFRLAWGNDWVESGAKATLAVNGATYPEFISVMGEGPGTTTGHVKKYGPHWISTEKFGYRETTLNFGIPNWGEGVGSHPNRNPHGFFHVLGAFYAEPPEATGELILSNTYVLEGQTTNVGWKIFRTGSDSTHLHNCTYCTQGDATIIGTPPGGVSTSDDEGEGDSDGGGNGGGNNGHGNNIDGVDSSNPGQGHGGPSGQEDPSGDFDDEGSQGNGWKKKNK